MRVVKSRTMAMALLMRVCMFIFVAVIFVWLHKLTKSKQPFKSKTTRHARLV